MKSLAVIGAGLWGRNLVRNFHALGVLHSVCDQSQERRAQLAVDYPGLTLVSDPEALFQEEQIGAVCIATPAWTHFELARAALCAGKDVYVEKPLCLQLSEAQELVELAEQEQRVLMCGHLLQYHPHFETLVELAKSGECGRLLRLEARRHDLGRFRFEENALWNFAPHDFSMLLALAGDDQATHVRCVGQRLLTQEVEDDARVEIEFTSGLHAHVTVSWLQPIKEQRTMVVGTGAIAIFDDTAPWEQKLTIHRDYLRYEDQSPQLTKVEAEVIAVDKAEPLRNECQHFIDCCRERRTPRTDGREALRVQALLSAAQESLEQGGSRVTVPSLERLASTMC